MKTILLAGAVLSLCYQTAAAQSCKLVSTGVFVPQKKSISLLSAGDGSKVVYFLSKLRVNTDGAPNSYHPFDPRGSTKAINNIANGIAIYKDGKSLGYSDTINAFEQWRDAGWKQQNGYRVSWQNVLAARKNADGQVVPCTFSDGPFAGYFVSLTAMKNRLPPDKAGECGANDQLDEREIPALVLAGGKTPMSQWGVRVGDLVVARNPATNVVVAAVVGDTGPPENLGEGSVALNMKLLGRTQQPQNYGDAKRLDTGDAEIEVAIFPGTASYNWASPISSENLRNRVDQWLIEHTMPEFAEAPSQFSSCQK